MKEPEIFTFLFINGELTGPKIRFFIHKKKSKITEPKMNYKNKNIILK